MEDFEDYYHLLEISSTATIEEIKKAYIDQCYIFHPDRLAGAPATAKRRAEERLKKVNQAYEVLKDPQSRRQYDSSKTKSRQGASHSQNTSSSHQSTVSKPRPTVDPSHIQFHDVEPGTAKTATFIIDNKGGPCSKIWFSTPEPWLKVVCWTSLSNSGTFPLEFQIEAIGNEWDKLYAETIIVRLDSEQTQVTVHLKTRQQPVRQKTTTTASSHSTAHCGTTTTAQGNAQQSNSTLLSIEFEVIGVVTSILTGIFFMWLAFQAVTASECAIIFLSGLSLSSLASYICYRTKWLKTVNSEPLAVQVGAWIAIICGLIVAGAFALTIAIAGGLLYLFFIVLGWIGDAVFKN